MKGDTKMCKGMSVLQTEGAMVGILGTSSRDILGSLRLDILSLVFWS